MPTEADVEKDRKSNVSPKPPTKQESKRKESGESGDGRLGQLMDNNGLKNSGLFGLVQYFMDRPDVSSQSSGASSPLPASVSAATPAEVPASSSPTGPSSQPTSNNSPAASPDPELVKNEVFSDGNKSDKSEVLRNEPGLEQQQPSQNSRTYLKSEEYRQLFHLPPEEILVEDFNCALQKKILLQGHMYLFERYVCFYSNIFGYEKKHFFASFLSRDEAYRLIINGWSQHSGYARIFLRSNYSPMSMIVASISYVLIQMYVAHHLLHALRSKSIAVIPIEHFTLQCMEHLTIIDEASVACEIQSPPSQGRILLDSAVMSSSWRSPQRATNTPADESYTPRNMEDEPNLVAPSIMEEVRDIGSLEGLAEPADGDNSVEGVPDERLSINESSSVSTSSVSPIWELEDVDAPGMPDGYKTLVESEFSVDVEEFFQLYFSDEAADFYKHFHSKCGDDDFRCTQWAKHRHFGHARDISFRHPINFFLGPKSTYCHESQRFRVYRNSHLILETSQQMTDIPYGDYFRVEVRWDVERLCGKVSNHCFVRVSLGVTFCKKTVWKGKIEQGTYDESKEAYTTWILEAHSMLRDIRSMAAEPGTAENLVTGPSSKTVGETAKRRTTIEPGSETSSEAEKTVHSEGEQLVKPSSVVGEELQNSDISPGMQYLRWRRKGSAAIETLILISQKLWNKSQNIDFKANKQLKLLCFLAIALLVVLMQVGIMIALARSPKVQYVSLGYPNSKMTAGMCFGGPKGDEALGWLEQRARHMKEEIVLAEARLQTLNQDLAVLKMHASRLLSFVDTQFNSEHVSSE